MGHFAQYCAISKIAITGGTPCGIIILAPRSRIGSSEAGFHNSWAPFAPPVFGVYDDYGRLEKIEPGVGASAIERLTKKEIKAAMDDFLDPRRDAKIHKSLTGFRHCWVRRDVWDMMLSQKKKSYPSDGHFDLGNHGFLMSLGAKKLSDLDRTERYYKQYQIGDQILRSDGTWLDCSIYDVEKLGKKLKVNVDKYLTWSNQDLWRVNTGDDREAAMAKVMWTFGMDTTGLRSIAYRRQISRVSKKTGKTMQDPFDIERQVYGDEEVKKYEKQTAVTRDLLKRIKDDSVCEALADVSKVVIRMNSFSSVLSPISTFAPQDGEHEEHLEILNGFVEIIKKELRRYGKR